MDRWHDQPKVKRGVIGVVATSSLAALVFGLTETVDPWAGAAPPTARGRASFVVEPGWSGAGSAAAALATTTEASPRARTPQAPATGTAVGPDRSLPPGSSALAVAAPVPVALDAPAAPVPAGSDRSFDAPPGPSDTSVRSAPTPPREQLPPVVPTSPLPPLPPEAPGAPVLPVGPEVALPPAPGGVLQAIGSIVPLPTGAGPAPVVVPGPVQSLLDAAPSTGSTGSQVGGGDSPAGGSASLPTSAAPADELTADVTPAALGTPSL